MFIIDSAEQLEKHLKMLRSWAEEQVEHFVADVVNKGSTDAKVSFVLDGVFIDGYEL